MKNTFNNRLKIFLLSALLPFTFSINSEEYTLPERKKQITGIKDLQWKEWFVFQKEEGDLTNDGKEDLIFVLKHTSENSSNSSSPRILAIYRKEKPNLYKILEFNSTFLLKKEEGGIMGDPLQKISINRGSILIEHSGGSREKWTYIHRFNFRDNKFYLIGITETIIDSITGKSTNRDTNLLTGKREIFIEKENAKPVKKLEIIPKKSLQTLEESKVFAE